MSIKIFLIVAAVITAIPLLLSEFVPAVGAYGDEHSWIYSIAIFWVLFASPSLHKRYIKKDKEKDATTKQ
jgi:hypothetical protein